MGFDQNSGGGLDGLDLNAHPRSSSDPEVYIDPAMYND